TKHTVLADRSSALHEKRKLIKEKKQKKIKKRKKPASLPIIISSIIPLLHKAGGRAGKNF
ncbi:MAG: hypothetical protein II551_02910, partial [Paludibacteraceae bacterium]|nr:hypothetical protein [Paludibacteraceae bacterium]